MINISSAPWASCRGRVAVGQSLGERFDIQNISRRLRPQTVWGGGRTMYDNVVVVVDDDDVDVEEDEVQEDNVEDDDAEEDEGDDDDDVEEDEDEDDNAE